MHADLMTKGLPHKRHKGLLKLMGVGSCEQTTTRSRVEDTGNGSRRCNSMEITSGSQKSRNSHGSMEPVSNHLIFAISIATGAIPTGVRLNTGVLSIAKVDQ